MKKIILSINLIIFGTNVYATTTTEILNNYINEASTNQSDFKPSAQRGELFYKKFFNISSKLPSCTTCHMDNPTMLGQHKITGKTINPLSPKINAVRFSDQAKVEKWFKRNCNEVVGRECLAGEKADLVLFFSK